MGILAAELKAKQGKHFFFEKKKQKTFDSAVAPESGRHPAYLMIQLFGHPFSSYTWKAKIALFENDTAFTFRQTDPEHPENAAESLDFCKVQRLRAARQLDSASTSLHFIGLWLRTNTRNDFPFQNLHSLIA